MPKVTILIPAYNQADFILDAVNSALDQTYTNLEIIVGDDASTDDTREKINQLNNSRVNYIRNLSNIGRVANYRNLLYEHATGDYVVNLDGDDFFIDPDFIVEAIKLVQNRKDVALVSARAKWVYSKKTYYSSLPNLKEIDGLFILKNLPNKTYFIKHLSTLYSRKFAIANDFYRSETLSSDWESLYRLSLHGKVIYLNRIVGVWRQHKDNETGTLDVNKKFNNLSIWPIIYKEAVLFGMNRLLAAFISAKCVAFFAGNDFRSISLTGNKNTLIFFKLIIKNYKLSAVLLALQPVFWIRFIVCLLGYYRIRGRE